MIKGSNHHVMPYDSGWCVISESNQKVINHFPTRELATEYASQCAKEMEGSVLVHITPATVPTELSTVALPQQDVLLDSVHGSPQGLRSTHHGWSATIRSESGHVDSGFDPLLGYDASYFDF